MRYSFDCDCREENAPAEMRKAEVNRPILCRLIFLAALAFLSVSVARADALHDIRQRGTLRWGGDQEGGGPYVYPRQDNPNQVTGFEVEVAASIADYLKVRPEFTQG